MRIPKIGILTLCLLLLNICTVFAAPSVTADKTTFDILTGTYKLTGNVCVKTDRFVVNADKAQVSLTSFEVWANGNIKCHYNQEKDLAAIDFTGQDLYGSWNSKTITVKGGTTFKSGNLTIKANKTSFNWETKIADFSGNVEINDNGKITNCQEIKYNVIKKEFVSENGEECVGDLCPVKK